MTANLRILYLSASFPLITETFIVYEIADLLRAGADIRIVSMAKPAPAALSSLCDSLGFADRIFYRADLKTGKFLKFLRSLHLMASGVFPSSRKSKEFSSYGFLETASAVRFGDWTPDIVHCHFGPAGNLGAALKTRGVFNAILTTTFHGYDISQLLREKPPGFYDELFKNGDHFFSINDYYLKSLGTLGAPPEKTSLFHMGVDCAALSYMPRALPQDGAIECVSVGRMTEKKGFAHTIRAFAKAVEARPGLDLKLNLIGDGPLLGEMQSLADTLGMHDRITFHGPLQHAQVQELLQCMHIFLLPSVTAANGDMEGIPVALMEAMAMGLPALSTYHSGIPELIEDGVSGFLVAEKDDAALAGKILHLLDCPDLWPAMTLAARQKIEADFNRETQSRSLYATFSKLAERRP